MTTKALAAMTPAEIDTELARIMTERSELAIQHRREMNTLRLVKAGNRRYSWMKAEDIEATIEKLILKIEALTAEADPYEAEFTRRGGWFRYFLVNNSNGHVHRGMDCTTCYWDTRYSWLIDLADCDENAMIEEWGEKACTVCFPTAPVNPFYNRPSRRDREAVEAREAEKRAKEELKRKKEEARLEREAKAKTKAERVAAEKAAGTYKMTPTEKRGAAVEGISKAYYGPAFKNYGEARVTDWDALVAACDAALEAGRAAGWKGAVTRLRKAAEAKDDTAWIVQLMINLSHEI